MKAILIDDKNSANKALMIILKQHFKEVEIDQLPNTINKIGIDLQHKKTNYYPSLITIPTKLGKAFIKVQNIIRAEANGSYCTIYVDNNTTHTISHNLKFFESLLNPKLFYRCHNSHLVNIGKVKELITEQGTVALMEDDSEVYISLRKKNDFLEAIKTYMITY